MKINPLLELEKLGQSIWMDFIGRGLTSSGELRRLIEQDGVSGVTSNPSIFEKSIVQSHDYDEAIQTLSLKGMTVEQIFQALSLEDIQNVADLLRPTYDRTGGADGFVSLEVSPRLAHDTPGTLEEARRLWRQVDRPNVMIKVPGTLEGLPAIRQLTGEGLNINITLLFSLPRYRQVADAYMRGLESFAAKGGNLRQVSSVATFFLSRIDVLLDPLLEKMSKESPQAETAARLAGQAAIASAKVAYEMYKEIFGSDRFGKLAKSGARAQRLLWASTSTKNPSYRDTKYVEALIGPHTINTLPIETLNAYRDHGHPKAGLEKNTAGAQRVLQELASLGIDLQAVTQQLEDEGVQKFNVSFERIMVSLKEKQAALSEPAGS